MNTLLSKMLESTPYLLNEETGSAIIKSAKSLTDDVELLRSGGRLAPQILKSLRQEWGFLQVYESAGIEGNQLDLNETQMAIQRGIDIAGKPTGDSDEVRNLYNALEYLETLVNEDRPLSEWEIREIHKLVLGQSHPAGGVYRQVEVAISNAAHIPPHPIKVQEMMTTLASWLAKDSFVPIPLRAAVLHAWLAHIHPFSDGNGRTARAVMNLVLMRHGFPVVVLRRKDRQRYYDALAQSDQGDIGAFIELLIDRMRDSLAHIDKIRVRSGFMDVAMQKIKRAEERRFSVWSDSVSLFLSTLEQLFRTLEDQGLLRVDIRRYDMPDAEDYRSICEKNTSANTWLMRIKLSTASATHSFLLWLGHASNEMLSKIGNTAVIPSIKISAQNPDGYPQWIECDSSFPSQLREIAYHEGKFYTRRLANGSPILEMADSVVSVCDRLAGELAQGWFA